MKVDTTSQVAWIALSLAIAALFLRHDLFGNSIITISVQVIALALWFWARAAFGRRSFHGSATPSEGPLVTTGPYRLVRHPIYASLLYLVWAALAAHPSAVNGLCAVIATVAVAVRIKIEEQLLLQIYPEYKAYCARTNRVLPFVL